MTAVNPKELRAVADAKDPLDFIEPALEGPLAHVMEHGAAKYGYRNYTVSPCKIRTYIGAVRRHTNALACGEDIDPDSGQPHWAHIAACCAVVLGSQSAGMLVDDREGFATPLSDRVHVEGDRDAKGLTAEYNRGVDELVEEMVVARGYCPTDGNRVGDSSWCSERCTNGICAVTGEPVRRVNL